MGALVEAVSYYVRVRRASSTERTRGDVWPRGHLDQPGRIASREEKQLSNKLDARTVGDPKGTILHPDGFNARVGPASPAGALTGERSKGKSRNSQVCVHPEETALQPNKSAVIEALHVAAAPPLRPRASPGHRPE